MMRTVRIGVLGAAVIAGICLTGPARRFLGNVDPAVNRRLDRQTVELQQAAKQGFPVQRSQASEVVGSVIHGVKWLGAAVCIYIDTKPHPGIPFMPDTAFVDLWNSEHKAAVDGSRPPMPFPCDSKTNVAREAAALRGVVPSPAAPSDAGSQPQ